MNEELYALKAENAKLREEREEMLRAINNVWAVASGECPVRMDDAQAMEWISDYLSSICIEDSPHS